MNDTTSLPLKKIKRVVRAITYSANVFFLSLLAITIFVAVFLRYVFRVSVPEVTVIQRFAVAWLVFLGSAMAVWDDQHLKIDMFGPSIPERVQRIRRIVIDVLTLGALVLLGLVGYRALIVGLGRTELIEIRFFRDRISLAYFNSAFFVGAVLMLVFHVFNLIERYTRHKSGGNE